MGERSTRFGLEPAATDPESDNNPNDPFEAEIERSKAISLKRIADALWGTEDTTGIVQLLNGIEMNVRSNQP